MRSRTERGGGAAAALRQWGSGERARPRAAGRGMAGTGDSGDLGRYLGSGDVGDQEGTAGIEGTAGTGGDIGDCGHSGGTAGIWGDIWDRGEYWGPGGPGIHRSPPRSPTRLWNLGQIILAGRTTKCPICREIVIVVL